MLKSMLSVLAIVAFIGAMLFTATPAKATLEGSGIIGVVFVATDDGRRPVPDAQVLLKTPDGTIVARTTTSEHGRFAFRQVRPGRYIVEAAKRGVGQGAAHVAVEHDAIARVHIRLER